MVRKHDPNAAHLRVRLASSVIRKLDQAAKRNNRSMNAEIVARIERSFEREDEKVVTREDVVKVVTEQLAQARQELTARQIQRLQGRATRVPLELVDRIRRDLADLAGNPNDLAAARKAAQDAIAELDRIRDGAREDSKADEEKAK